MAQQAVSLSPDVLDALLPMHVVVASDETITHVGPTLAKVHPDQALKGKRFFEVFALRRPRGLRALDGLCTRPGGRFYLRTCGAEGTPLIATAVRLKGGQGVLVNLSFGFAVVDAVARYDLAGSDFAATDLTLEMLYLVEAKSAAMAESRKLNDRLNGARARAEARAMSDTLTGLRNRRALDEMLERFLQRKTVFTLMHLDLDYFKQVNDTLGHAAGDRVLVEVARVLLAETRPDDVVARVGGDEFVLLFNGLDDRAQMEKIAGRLISTLEAPIAFGEQTARISASIGMVTSTHYQRPNLPEMLRDADAALYASKARGRARFTFFPLEEGAAA